MFNLSYTQPRGVVGTIKMKYFPMSLGFHQDVEGNNWHVNMVVYKENIKYVCACPIGELHPYYSDTSGSCFGLVEQHWLPYEVQVV